MLRENTTTQRKADVPEMLSMFSQPFYGKLGQNGPICKRYLIAKMKKAGGFSRHSAKNIVATLYTGVGFW
jgi:hypothetical protein